MIYHASVLVTTYHVEHIYFDLVKLVRNKMIRTGLLVLTLLIYCCSSATMSQNIVATKVGSFVGVTHSVSLLVNNGTRSVSRFLGIPYAKPPIGELRFSKPEPYGAIQIEYNATYYRPHCIQSDHTYEYIDRINIVESEDCLYLNIYKPGTVSMKKHAVMVFIHGGGFGGGGADIYDGDRLSTFHDVIVVVINYRLNIFGFLSDGSSMTGNYGLWDMKLALHWIHDNIEAFGGDSNAVTIFGNSAGGAAVLYQATQPSNKGLFQRVISQSGSLFGLWAYSRDPGDKFKTLVHRLNCERQSTSETMRCLRAITADKLKSRFHTTYLPTIDGEFIKNRPLSLIDSSETDAMTFFTGLDLIIGTTSQDGALYLDYWRRILMYYTTTTLRNKTIQNEDLPERLAYLRLFRTCQKVHLRNAKDLIELYSLDKLNVTDDFDALLERICDIETDMMMFVPAVLIAKSFTQSNANRNNYFYIFSQKPDFAPLPKILTGARHFMEVPYIFGLPLSFKEKMMLDYDANYPDLISPEDIKLSTTMMTLWSNFAKTGNPNGRGDTYDTFLPTWPRCKQETIEYLDISYSSQVRSLVDHPSVSHIEPVSKLLKEIDKLCTPKSSTTSISSTVSERLTSIWCTSALTIFCLLWGLM